MHSPQQRPPRLAPTNPFSTHIPSRWWRLWWRSLSPTHQDRLAAIAPLVSVALFLIAIASSFWYLRAEETEREQEALRRDVEFVQQRMRLSLLERQEQVMRLARDLSSGEIGTAVFSYLADQSISQYPELQSLTWIDLDGRVVISIAAPTVPGVQMHRPSEPLSMESSHYTNFETVRKLRQPLYHQPSKALAGPPAPLLQLQVPIMTNGNFGGAVMAEFSADNLLRYAAPTEVLARYAVSLLDAHGTPVAGNTAAPHTTKLPQILQRDSSLHEVVVSPVGESLRLKGVAYRTSSGVVGNGLFWLVGFLSLLTSWLLVATWRHTRRRLRTQEALVAETNFRRAMENSVLTGMRALDLEGRITYVNAAFCQMTGWSEQDLVGKLPPYPYWPDGDHEALRAKLSDELSGKTVTGGFQVRVKRKNGGTFDARLYVSPLIDAHGQHTGWMSSMTDITEPNRVRDQLAASHERFTIVLEALDASVSVAPLGSAELLFANKLYRQWFGSQTDGHLQLVQQAGVPTERNASQDEEDALMGLPTDSLTSATSKNAEIYLPELGRWLEVRSRYLSWVDGRLAQMVIATDITQRRNAQEQAAIQAERAQTSSRLITMGEMASSVAHELNQPLTAISNYCTGMLSRIESGTLTESQMKFALEKTAHQAQRAGQIIQRIRSFVKRSEPNRMLASVEHMVDEALELANIELRRRNVRLNHFVAPHLPPVMADSILIEQVLVNLVKNAAESIDQSARPQGMRTVDLKVQRHAMDGADGVEFAVQDTGKGLPPEVLERLFEAFFTTKSEGMGMGLNLCRSIVESHDGRMHAENLYNDSQVVGCRFAFWLPLAATRDRDKRDKLSNTSEQITRNPA